MEQYKIDQAHEIRQQIGNKCLTMIGAKYESIGENNGNPFYGCKIGKNPGKIGYLKVIYTPDDTYTLEFYLSNGYKLETLPYVYNEDLTRVIAEKTGMAVTL